MPGYNYSQIQELRDAKNIRGATMTTIMNYFHYQLGWSIKACENRLEKEINREIPKATFNKLKENYHWEIKDAKFLDVGSGQGGTVLEALERGARATGIEPGSEFAKLSKMRLKQYGYDPNLIIKKTAEELPFDNSTFDYIISLQVLEHVENPEPILKEIYRVLKPGGKCWISCENYLSFREQHYRMRWLPLLPKWLGTKYLMLRGKDPYFLNRYIFYTTYPQIWRLCKKIGFENETYNNRIKKINSQNRLTFRVLSYLPYKIEISAAKILYHIKNTFKVGIRFCLVSKDKLD
jgi:ubiquinone/menaquinone biosynthesis C-methylase UbiE